MDASIRGAVRRDFRHAWARRQRHHPDLRARAGAEPALHAQQGDRKRPIEAVNAGLPRFAHGDFGEAEIFAHRLEYLQPEAVRLFREGRDPHGAAQPRTSPCERAGIGGAEQCPRRGDHHGQVRDGDGRTGARPPQTQYCARTVQRDFRRLCRQENTLARQIIDGQNPVRILGDDIPVKAGIHTINGFSAHADQAGLLTWHGHTGAARTFLTHGEAGAMQAFAARLVKRKSKCPRLIRASIYSQAPPSPLTLPRSSPVACGAKRTALSVKMQVDFAADEAVQSYSIDNVTACRLRRLT